VPFLIARHNIQWQFIKNAKSEVRLSYFVLGPQMDAMYQPMMRIIIGMMIGRVKLICLEKNKCYYTIVYPKVVGLSR
jgi:hypothetical protein